MRSRTWAAPRAIRRGLRAVSPTSSPFGQQPRQIDANVSRQGRSRSQGSADQRHGFSIRCHRTGTGTVVAGGAIAISRPHGHLRLCACRFESCRAYHINPRVRGSRGGFDRWGLGVCNTVCNGLGHNVARVGTTWHNPGMGCCRSEPAVPTTGRSCRVDSLPCPVPLPARRHPRGRRVRASRVGWGARAMVPSRASAARRAASGRVPQPIDAASVSAVGSAGTNNRGTGNFPGSSRNRSSSPSSP